MQDLSRQNLELKCKWNSHTTLPKECTKSEFVKPLKQYDTYYENCDGGRLKIRSQYEEKCDGETTHKAYAIYYKRPDTKMQKFSNYEFYPIEDYKNFVKVFGSALKTEVIVIKERTLYYYKRDNKIHARIHLDVVENLGNFLEIEVVLEEAENRTESSYQEAQEMMNELIHLLNIKDEDKISKGYRELLIEKDAA